MLTQRISFILVLLLVLTLLFLISCSYGPEHKQKDPSTTTDSISSKLPDKTENSSEVSESDEDELNFSFEARSSFLSALIESDERSAIAFLKNAIFYGGGDFGLMRIANVMKKAMEGEPILIGAIGGSITQGASAIGQHRSFSYLVYQWWEATFPEAKVEYLNAGEGATGSLFAVHRVKENLLDQEPDFVMIDFSVNDSNSQIEKDASESLLRRILQADSNPGALHIAFTQNPKANVQSMHESVYKRYGVPLLSFHDAVWHEIDLTQNLTINKVHADYIHPNNEGHKLAADIIIYKLQQIYDSLPDKITVETVLPQAITENSFMNARILNNNTCSYTDTKGFTPEVDMHHNELLAKGWQSSGSIGDIITFEITAKRVAMSYFVSNQGDAAEKVKISLSDKEPQILSAYHEHSWTYPKTVTIVSSPSVSTHTITVEVVDGGILKILGFLIAD